MEEYITGFNISHQDTMYHVVQGLITDPYENLKLWKKTPF
jgi:hypothetical protein